MLESTVEKHLAEQVKERGGEIRKLKWIGRRHAPDRYVLLPHAAPTLVELKRPGAKPRPGQAREIARLRDLGQQVEVFDSVDEIDKWLAGYDWMMRMRV